MSGEDGILKADSGDLFFGTSNRDKFDEAARILEPYGIRLKFLGEKGVELQSDSLEEIAKYAAKSLSEKRHVPIVIEDAGLFIDCLQGFPGPYSAYVYGTVGVAGIVRILDGFRERSASFVSVVAFCSPGSEPLCFSGVVKGRIAEQALGSKGFGFDPIFVPDGFGGRTFAQMEIEEKNLVSHRFGAFKRFAEWYASGRR